MNTSRAGVVWQNKLGVHDVHGQGPSPPPPSQAPVPYADLPRVDARGVRHVREGGQRDDADLAGDGLRRDRVVARHLTNRNKKNRKKINRSKGTRERYCSKAPPP